MPALALPACLHAQAVRPLDAPPPAPLPAKSRIAILENPALVDRFQIDDARVAENFNRSFLSFTKRNSLKEAWGLFVSPSDTVGIHISTAGGSILSTHRSLLQAVVKGLMEAGVPPSKIIVWDKFEDQMIGAGYVPMQPDQDWKCLSVIPGEGFDPEKFYFNEVVGQLIWGDSEFRGKAKTVENLINSVDDSDKKDKKKDAGKAAPEPQQISNRSYFNNIVSRQVTKIINIPVMSDHQKFGLNGCIATLAMASVDNNRRFYSPSETSGLALAEIMNNDLLKKKTVLHIVDGLIAQFAGGPDFIPHYAASPGIIMIGKDPVALDTLCLERLEKWRAEKKVVPIGNDAVHLRLSAKYGLGTTSKDSMEIIRVQ
ncbi:MAG: DUF362 domain-containing protein [Methylacidiphilales bacterium]|nr:DUF362 domain-containing protein [Candidatus Methylacidiphilales bacterium]